MIDKIHITDDVINSIINHMRSNNYECGGIIGKDSGGVVIKFFADEAPIESTSFTYKPNVDKMNEIINDVWLGEKIEFAGFVHSHINNGILSDADIQYIRRILKEIVCNSLLCGIYNISYNGKKTNAIYWYLVKETEVKLLRVKKASAYK